MKTAFSLLCLLLFTSVTAHAQLIQLPFPFPFPREVPRIYIPTIDSDTSSFAYLEESGSGQRLQLARLVQAFLLPTAIQIATLANENGTTETISDLYASPSNRWLAVYTFQDTGAGFVDHNLSFFDMQTGDGLGLRNEHAFSPLNQALVTSERLQEFKEAETLLGVPPEMLAELDYAVVTEGANIPLPLYQWNADGTFSLTFELEVEAFYPDSVGQFIGTETFTMNIAVGKSGIATIDYDNSRTPAIFPNVFTLTPNSGPVDQIRFESQLVRFRGFYYSLFLQRFLPYYYYPTASMTEGNIPRRYRSLF